MRYGTVLGISDYLIVSSSHWQGLVIDLFDEAQSYFSFQAVHIRSKHVLSDITGTRQIRTDSGFERQV